MALQTTQTRAHKVAWGPWSPAQFVVVALGGFLILMGALVLAKTGVANLTLSRATVWGMEHTPLMGMIAVSLGLLVLTYGPYPYSARNALFGIGALMAVFGLIALIEPALFSDTLGMNRPLAVFYLVGGAASTMIGSLSPVIGK
jgi:hypothetical protein